MIEVTHELKKRYVKIGYGTGHTGWSSRGARTHRGEWLQVIAMLNRTNGHNDIYIVQSLDRQDEYESDIRMTIGSSNLAAVLKAPFYDEKRAKPFHIYDSNIEQEIIETKTYKPVEQYFQDGKNLKTRIIIDKQRRRKKP